MLSKILFNTASSARTILPVTATSARTLSLHLPYKPRPKDLLPLSQNLLARYNHIQQQIYALPVMKELSSPLSETLDLSRTLPPEEAAKVIAHSLKPFKTLYEESSKTRMPTPPHQSEIFAILNNYKNNQIEAGYEQHEIERSLRHTVFTSLRQINALLLDNENQPLIKGSISNNIASKLKEINEELSKDPTCPSEIKDIIKIISEKINGYFDDVLSGKLTLTEASQLSRVLTGDTAHFLNYRDTDHRYFSPSEKQYYYYELGLAHDAIALIYATEPFIRQTMAIAEGMLPHHAHYEHNHIFSYELREALKYPDHLGNALYHSYDSWEGYKRERFDLMRKSIEQDLPLEEFIGLIHMTTEKINLLKDKLTPQGTKLECPYLQTKSLQIT